MLRVALGAVRHGRVPSILNINISSSAVLWIRKLSRVLIYILQTAGFRRLQLQLQLQAPSPVLIALVITTLEPQGNASTEEAGIMKTSQLQANEDWCRNSTAEQDIDESSDVKVFYTV
ncbi:hypothetical protein Q7C36_012638 [Tachysurus vachellii]|uniref:Uncharacterized protein n=1 Tax=Tachysurus vachellii TaxID=175792 RepID=A0AA88MPT8_TACVA|nr:hypothetical protein Q7C36_012638 [Tachysurus vachellii]